MLAFGWLSLSVKSKTRFKISFCLLVPSGLTLRHEWKVAPSTQRMRRTFCRIVLREPRSSGLKLFTQRRLPPAFMYKAKFVSLPTVGGRNCYYTQIKMKTVSTDDLRREHALVVRMWISLTQVSARVTSHFLVQIDLGLFYSQLAHREHTSSHSIKIKRRGKLCILFTSRKWKVFRRQKPGNKRLKPTRIFSDKLNSFATRILVE